MRPLLLLRPEPAAQISLARALALNLDAHSFPLFRTTPVAWRVPDPKDYSGLMLTSANAVRLSGEGLAQLLSMPVFAVGEASATAARDAGFTSMVTGDADVARLLARLAPLGHQKLLHLCGADYISADSDLIEVERRPVYRAEPVEPPAGLITILDRSPVIAVHSPRAASRIAALCDQYNIDRSTICIAAISANAAAAAGDGWQKLAIADKPRDVDVIEAAKTLCQEQ